MFGFFGSVLLVAASATASAPTTAHFRCRELSLAPSGAARAAGDVVVRLDDAAGGRAWLCCATLELGEADTAGRRPLACRGDVRLARPGEAAWAEAAHLEADGRSLTLSGAPWVHARGARVRAERVEVDLARQGLVVLAPDGIWEPAPPPASPQVADEASLPARCPLPPRPRA